MYHIIRRLKNTRTYVPPLLSHDTIVRYNTQALPPHRNRAKTTDKEQSASQKRPKKITAGAARRGARAQARTSTHKHADPIAPPPSLLPSISVKTRQGARHFLPAPWFLTHALRGKSKLRIRPAAPEGTHDHPPRACVPTTPVGRKPDIGWLSLLFPGDCFLITCPVSTKNTTDNLYLIKKGEKTTQNTTHGDRRSLSVCLLPQPPLFLPSPQTYTR